MEQSEFHLPTREFVEQNFERILHEIESLKKQTNKCDYSAPAFYRNKDLKQIFGLSANTIYDYREKGILPYTKLGEIYYYPVQEIQRILNQNSNRDKIV